ncbi:hypothetical protein R2R70_18660 [Cobetia sp. SIMBA_158]|uniref:hypothetical protein n=1 Tax=Cobetia sp. SIMBA_158 TaxID=3081617 RepID=UPI003980F6FB
MALDTRQHIPDTMDDSVIIYSCTGDDVFPGIIAFTSGDDEQSYALTLSSDDTVDVDNNCITVSGHAIAYHDIPHSIYVSNVTYLQLTIQGCPPLDDMKSIQSSPLWLHDFPVSQKFIDFFSSLES